MLYVTLKYIFNFYFWGGDSPRHILITWSFSFQILSEIRHLIMDFGYGFEIKTTKITGLIVIFGSLILTVVFFLIGKNFF